MLSMNCCNYFNEALDLMAAVLSWSFHQMGVQSFCNVAVVPYLLNLLNVTKKVYSLQSMENLTLLLMKSVYLVVFNMFECDRSILEMATRPDIKGCAHSC